MNRAALDRATAALDPPFAVVDLDAFDANAADLLRRAGTTALRLASKSVRCRALQRRALDAGFRGHGHEHGGGGEHGQADAGPLPGGGYNQGAGCDPELLEHRPKRTFFNIYGTGAAPFERYASC